MVIKPKSKGFICITAHPVGCRKNVEDMVNAARAAKPDEGVKPPKNVLVVGASGGYGLASRVVAAFTYGAKTVGVSLEREASGKRTATAGFYNNQAFDALAQQYGIPHATINGDAYSNATKAEVVAACRALFGGEKIDLLVYSLASPKCTDPDTGEVYSSVIKPIGEGYHNKTVDFHTGVVSEVEITPAGEEETAQTVKVMGGEDWQRWVDTLGREDLLAEGFITLAYTYIGPEVTHPIYKDGTIGRAKEHLLETSRALSRQLAPVGGKAYISVNKALVTQASSAIPVVPLYISLMYRVMKEKGLHEGCLEQMRRLFTEHLYATGKMETDAEGRIRLDDWEMRPDVQAEIDRCWPLLETETMDEYADLKGYRDEFFSLFGFGRDDVDYEADVAEY